MTFGASSKHAVAVISDNRPPPPAELGVELITVQRRNGLAVDEMAVPAASEQQHVDQHSAAPAPQIESTAAPMRVVVAEDDVLLREGLASLLDRSGFDVVGQAGDGPQLLGLVREQAADLVVT